MKSKILLTLILSSVGFAVYFFFSNLKKARVVLNENSSNLALASTTLDDNNNENGNSITIGINTLHTKMQNR